MWLIAILFFCFGATLGMIGMALMIGAREYDIDPHAEEFTQDR